MICPVCRSEKVRGSHPQGYWEREVFCLLFFRPFRCRLCRSRFLRFSIKDQSPRRKRKKKTKARVAEEFGIASQEDFQELIGQIHEAELQIESSDEAQVDFLRESSKNQPDGSSRSEGEGES